MGKIVRYTSEELKKIPSINITALPNIIDDDIEFDASHDITDEMIVRFKQKSAKDKIKTINSNDTKRVYINLKNDIVNKLKQKKSWKLNLETEISKLVANGTL